MSLYVRSVARRAFLLANYNGGCANLQNKAGLGTLAPETQSRTERLENNIVASPFGDCQLHYQPMHQRVFESAAKWPNNVALVSESWMQIHVTVIQEPLLIRNAASRGESTRTACWPC